MDEIRLDGRGWETTGDFYNAFLAAVGAPDWHGKNLDALWDSIVGGRINGRELPYRIVISGCNYMGVEAAQTVERFRALIEEAERRGYTVGISLNPD